MLGRLYAKRINSALLRSGETVTLIIGGERYRKRAVVQNAGKNFMRKYDDDDSVRRDLGRALKRDKVAFLPYFKELEGDGVVIVIYRGKPYVMLADSAMAFGDQPCYVWALLRELTVKGVNYYDDFVELDTL